MFHIRQTITSIPTRLKSQGKRYSRTASRPVHDTDRGVTYGFGPQVTIRIIRAKRYEEKIRQQSTRGRNRSI